MTQSTDEWNKEFLEYVEHLRRQPPRPGFPRKTITELCIEQGVGPINAAELMAIARGSSPEDVEENQSGPTSLDFRR